MLAVCLRILQCRKLVKRVPRHKSRNSANVGNFLLFLLLFERGEATNWHHKVLCEILRVYELLLSTSVHQRSNVILRRAINKTKPEVRIIFPLIPCCIITHRREAKHHKRTGTIAQYGTDRSRYISAFYTTVYTNFHA